MSSHETEEVENVCSQVSVCRLQDIFGRTDHDKFKDIFDLENDSTWEQEAVI